jgi:ribosomal protein S18 acetylase RimI-like enzyme
MITGDILLRCRCRANRVSVPSAGTKNRRDPGRPDALDGSVHLRAAQPADVGFLADVVISATRDQGRLDEGFDEAGFRAEFERWTLEQVAGAIEGSSTYVVEVDGERAGRLRVVRHGTTVELAGLQLLPRFQSHGVGSDVLVLLKAEAASMQGTLELSVDVDNPRAQALYERHGLTVFEATDKENRLRWPAAR